MSELNSGLVVTYGVGTIGYRKITEKRTLQLRYARYLQNSEEFEGQVCEEYTLRVDVVRQAEITRLTGQVIPQSVTDAVLSRFAHADVDKSRLFERIFDISISKIDKI